MADVARRPTALVGGQGRPPHRGAGVPARPSALAGESLAVLGLRLPIIAIGLALTVAHCVFAVQALGVPWPTVNTEGNQLTGVMRLRNGEPLYQDYRQFPFHVNQYPPLLYLLSGWTSRLLDLTAWQTMVAARGVSLLAAIASVGLIYALARAHGRSRVASLAGAGLFLSLPFLDPWGFTIRVDMLAMAITLGAALLLVRRPDRPWAAAAVAALALFAKQTMVAFPVAAVLWLLWRGTPRAALGFLGVWLGALFGGLGLAELVTGGVYLQNTFFAHMNPTNGFDAAARMFVQFPQQAWLPVALALGAVAVEGARHRRLELMGCYWVVALGLCLFTLRGRGADINYFIEPAAIACVLAAGALDGLWARLAVSGRASLAGAAALLVAAAAWAFGSWQEWRDSDRFPLDRRLPIEDMARYERVLAEEPLMTLLAGKPVVLSDPFHVSQMTSAGRFDPTELTALVRDRHFDLIVIRGDARQPRSINGQIKWPEPVIRAVAEYYVHRGTRGPYWLYEPDWPQRSQRR